MACSIHIGEIFFPFHSFPNVSSGNQSRTFVPHFWSAAIYCRSDIFWIAARPRAALISRHVSCRFMNACMRRRVKHSTAFDAWTHVRGSFNESFQKKPDITFICPRQRALPKPKRSFRFTLQKHTRQYVQSITPTFKINTLSPPPSYCLYIAKLLRELLISILNFMMPQVISSIPLNRPFTSDIIPCIILSSFHAYFISSLYTWYYRLNCI